MHLRLTVLLLALSCCCLVLAAVTPFPATFHTEEIRNGEVTLHVRVGGHGPAVVLLHGFGDTGDMWAPLAAALARDHRVVVPDLRGMGLSSHPAAGYDKRTQAGDVRAVLAALGIDHAAVVGHDIGTMVAYAYAALYARPGAMRSAFAQFRSIRQDAVDNATGLQTRLPMPVLAIGGEKSFGANEAVVMRNAADHVTELVVPGAGHWLMEEAPQPVIDAVEHFLAAPAG